jgi:hypothetical protein
MVFAGIYPLEHGGFPQLEEAVRRVRSFLRLMDILLMMCYSSRLLIDPSRLRESRRPSWDKDSVSDCTSPTPSPPYLD